MTNHSTALGLLVLRHIQVQNANAVAGVTYGFPAVTHFLGFVHALQRKLNRTYPGLRFGGCAIMSHDQQIHCHTGKYNQRFALTRNPLTPEGKSPAFVEEGRMHLTVSLIIECYFTQWDLLNWSTQLNDVDPKAYFIKCVGDIALSQRLGGGVVIQIPNITFEDIGEHLIQKTFRRLSPGFLLRSRHTLLQSYREKNPTKDAMTAWLDFVALKSQAATPNQVVMLASDQSIPKGNTKTIYIRPDETDKCWAWWFDGHTFKGHMIADEAQNTFQNQTGEIAHRDKDVHHFDHIVQQCGYDPLLVDKMEWEYVPKPAQGWIVPIMSGYRAIHPLQAAGKVANARDMSTPSCFVEAVYTIAQWINPYRLMKEKASESAFWHYHVDLEQGWYLCQPKTQTEHTSCSVQTASAVDEPMMI